MAVNISATFTKDEKPRNGLVQIEDKLVNDDLLHAQYVVVATIRPKRVATDAEDGTKTPTIRFDHIEVLVDDPDVEVVRALLARRLKDRTGLDDRPPADLFSLLGDGEQDDDQDGEQDGVPEPDADELMARRAERQAAGLPAFSDGGEPL
ncbi:hypothetical protein ABZ847_29510 [Streptomyces bauhiniae]